MLDDKQRREESNAIEFGYELEDPLFKKGQKWTNPETNQEVPYEELRWSVFKSFSAQNMLHHVRNNVFVFIKGIGKESGSAYSRYMQDAVFSIPKADVLQSVVDDIDLLDMEDADTMGDVYEYMLAHMAIRKELVDKQCLRAVISMPAGVFQPYSGVSTAILVFTKTDAGGTDKVWFYEMRGDGFTLNAKRTPCSDDDIPDLLQRWQNLDAETDRTRKDQSFLVPVDEIRQNDYDLTFNKYKEVVREKVAYDDPKDVFARIEALEAQFAAKQQEFKQKYL